MRILITIGVCVLCGCMPFYAQDTGAASKASSKNEQVGEPAKNETGLKGLPGGETAATKGTAEKPPADTSSASVSERIIVEERELVDELEDDDDLHYLDEDHDE